MHSLNRKIDIRELLVHGDWVHAVARGLVDSAAGADDIVQATWLEALEKPPRSGHNLRGWLGRVALNQARQAGRGEARRLARERRVARPESVPSLGELENRAALQREVVGHVLALDEPYRSVVLLRFFDDLTPVRIAKRLQIPVKTVHSRLQRSLAKLRERLDKEYGNRGEWCRSLTPLAALSKATKTTAYSSSLITTGAWIMNARTVLTGAVLLLGGVGLWQLAHAALNGEPAEPAGVQEAVLAGGGFELESSGLAATLPEQTVAQREAVETPSPEADSSPEFANTLHVQGRALDMDGAGLEGVSIVLGKTVADNPVLSTDGGRFELTFPEPDVALFSTDSADACLRVDDPNWVTVRQSCVSESNLHLEHLIVAAPATSLEGWIQDSAGMAVAGARLRLHSTRKAFVGFPNALDMTGLVSRIAESDADGRFGFARFPGARGLGLQVLADGFQSTTIDLDQAERPLMIQLARTNETDQAILEGVVLDARGFGVSDALVRLADASVRSDRDGLFHLPIGRVAATTPLCAARAGSLPALIPNFGQEIERQGGTPGPVELILGGDPLTISGRIVDESGAACTGWPVAIVDATSVSQHRHPVDSAEDLARGGFQEVRTDDEGRFLLTGLYPREYRIQAFERRTLFHVERSIMAGSQDVVLHVSRSQRDPIDGLIVNAKGSPMSGVRVSLALDTSRSDVGYSSMEGAQSVTDEAGEFRFDVVPDGDVYLRYRGEQVLPGTLRFAGIDPAQRIEIEVVQRCHFRIEVDPSTELAEFFDENGIQLQINRFEAFGMSAFPIARLEDGKSEVLSVSESATTLVLKSNGVELSRHELRLSPGEVNVLRF